MPAQNVRFRGQSGHHPVTSWLFAVGLFLPVPGGNGEDEADYAEDEKHPLDEELVGHYDVERLGDDARDDANGA